MQSSAVNLFLVYAGSRAPKGCKKQLVGRMHFEVQNLSAEKDFPSPAVSKYSFYMVEN